MNMPVYLDYNATAPMRPAVRESMFEAMQWPLNPSSVHRYGAEAKKRLEAARKIIAHAVSAMPNEIIFTASGTEANSLALRGFPDRALITSTVEHASVAATASLLGAATAKVANDGIVMLPQLESLLANLGRPALVSVILANNETGIIQPMREIAELAHRYGALVHCDAVQAFGKIPLDMGMLGVDMMTISAHKVGGPVGVAALVLRNDLPVKPLLVGGRQEWGRRAGTEALPQIVGFATLAEAVMYCPESKQLAALQQRLERRLSEYSPLLQAVGSNVSRLPNTSMLTMPGVSSETQLMHFDLAGFCVSAGSACSSGRIEASNVLKAMDFAPQAATEAIRISTGWNSTEAEIDAFAGCWLSLYEKLGTKTPVKHVE